MWRHRTRLPTRTVAHPRRQPLPRRDRNMSDQHTLPTGHVRHVATERFADRITGPEFDAWLASVKANVWDEAKREVAMIPCWVNPETGLHGFDLHNETEQGARMEVMRVLDNNPYRKEQTDE